MCAFVGEFVGVVVSVFVVGGRAFVCCACSWAFGFVCVCLYVCLYTCVFDFACTFVQVCMRLRVFEHE